MKKNLAFIFIPETPTSYQIKRFREEAKKLTISLVEINPLETQLILLPDRIELLDKNNLPLPPCQAVFRKVIYCRSAMAIQEALISSGAKSIFPQKKKKNRGKLFHYLRFAENNIPFPKTFVLSNNKQLNTCLDFFNNTYPLVLKLSGPSTHGIGTILTDSKMSIKSITDYIFKASSAGKHPPPILVQEYIKESQGRDIRAVVLNKKVIAAVERDNSINDFRSNIFQGARVKNIKLTQEQKKIAIKAVNVFDLKFAGVDLMFGKNRALVTEVNSPCDYSFVEQKTKVNITKKLIKYLLT